MSSSQIEWRHLNQGPHRIPCPACYRGTKDDAMGLTVHSEGAIWHCFRCGMAGAERSGVQSIKQSSIPMSFTGKQNETLAPKWSLYFDRLPTLTGTLGEVYLRSRRCVIPPTSSALRFDPAAWHWPTRSKLPALVALLTDFQDARIQRSLHFTFLAADGLVKAQVDRNRLMLANHRKFGAVIRLWPDDEVTDGLALAEGIESALSAAHIFTPMWATGDAGNMAGLLVVEGISALTIFADHDKAGLDAAHKLAERWRAAGQRARILRAKAVGFDPNDVLKAAT